MADKRSGEERREKADGGQGPIADTDLERRFADLSRTLDKGKRVRQAVDEPERTDSSGYALALRIASEFIAGVLVGAALGWGLDEVAGTSPWGLIGFLMLGFAAGVLNVMRAAGKIAGPYDRLDKDKDGGPARHD
ncbi:ATP synthase protein I [Rhodopseudomonas julia]|uniref:ATP synthase protein I n=1 Tax=Rhodopseudomonas julia TaxID=200617 RepID=A0ABU0C4Z6_9BRAD|nr:AtpZ/AtpI family protein [Rhodopseudomonas julia]MDQ0324740.1 ATP synthase protein I [Rhodopseudomonas julia]